jgi:hypothetical protein
MAGRKLLQERKNPFYSLTAQGREKGRSRDKRRIITEILEYMYFTAV